MSKPKLQLLFLPNACEAYSRNIYIPTTIEMKDSYPALTLHKRFLGFNLTYMNITDYWFMQSLNVAKLTPEQLELLAHKLPIYTMVIHDFLREQIQQIDENYPYPMPTGLIILISVLGNYMRGAKLQFSFISKTKNALNHSKTLSIFWCKENT